ncbi:unnamed protein product [Hydatigera taeniaeformis]|uniref:Gamma-tubulin complex component n=1 Tax=Hydatigena taeniaeformis TaxID=6205 RepID=A0A0R3XBF3_HYDTA|nr:unnamed protein product [Hydatigera taeniaeformis]
MQVKEQHMQRCVSFLTDELKVCGHEEAMERVFFVSAREVLTIRAKSLNGGTPPGSAPNIGSPSTGGMSFLHQLLGRIDRLCISLLRVCSFQPFLAITRIT